MITLAFTLYDAKAKYFGVPFFMPHVGQAIRAAMDLGMDMDTTVARHPSDFHLYQIGTFDDQTSVLTAHEPISLGVVASFLPTPAPVGPLFREPTPWVSEGQADRAAQNGAAR